MTAQSLVDWYRLHARTLPWRKDVRDPYHVLVSEFMLQQTQVDRVVPRFESFVRKFPSFGALAAAEEDEVVEEWSGLGYYRRARMLHRLAAVVVAGTGKLPTSASDLEKLPGIGPYTAAAVASLVWDESVPVLDGNTMRVGARVLALESDPRMVEGRRHLGDWILMLMGNQSPGEVNEALMELGATVCTPADPVCSECPITTICSARRTLRQLDYPPPRRRRTTVDLLWATACCVDDDGRWLVRLVDDGPILRGLWLPPLIEIENPADAVPAATGLLPVDVMVAPRVGPVVRHHITHRRIDVIPVLFEAALREPTSELWRLVDPLNPGVPTSSLLKKLARASTG